MKKLYFALLVLALSFTVQAQKRVVLMGSSTAEGWFASSGNTMFDRLQAYYPTHTWINLGYRGLTTYQALATSVPTKPPIDLEHNITKALSYNPDIIIVSYPTNDVNNGYSNAETINNLSILYNIASANNVIMFFMGTQPRDFADEARRIQLSTQNDLILQTFTGKSINVYPFVARAGGYIATDVAFGDGIHLNDEGHRRLFQEIVNFNIFSIVLPIVINDFRGEMQQQTARLLWKARPDQQHAYVGVERSTDGQQFTEIGKVKPKANNAVLSAYDFADPRPAIGKNYYRLALVDKNGRKEFSKTIQLSNLSPGALTAFPVPAKETLHLSMVLSVRSEVTIRIMNVNGTVVLNTKRTADKGVNQINIPVTQFANGIYIVRVSSPDGTNTLRFMKQ